jgi:exosortase/archaeosortase family protein
VLLRQPSATLTFAITLLVYFAALTAAFEASRGSAFERIVVEQAILRPATALINLISPTERATLADRTISSPGSRLHVTRGCEGVEVILLLLAATLAFPAAWPLRAHGFAIGLVLAYAVSLGRLVALHFTLRYAPGAWESLHGLVLPLAPIIVITGYFLRWSGRVPLARAVATSADAP